VSRTSNGDEERISPGHSELYLVPGHAGVQGNEIADELARDGSVLEFVGLEPALGISRHDIQRRIRCCSVYQHWI
jgi:hypothetical protein